MTQVELAKACGVTQGTVAMWEKGVCFPKSEKIIRVAQALGCNGDQLLQMAAERKNQTA